MTRPSLTTQSGKYPCGPVCSTRRGKHLPNWAVCQRRGRAERDRAGRKGQKNSGDRPENCPGRACGAPGGAPQVQFVGRSWALEVVNPTAGHGRSALLLRLVGDDGLGRQEQSGDGGGVLERRA